MSARRELFEILARLGDEVPELRVAAMRAYLDGLPPDEADLAERRMLAFVQAFETHARSHRDITLEAFFEVVADLETGLVN